MSIVSDALPVQEEAKVWTPTAKTLDQLERHRPGDPNELLRHRFLCRGGSLLLVGPTGVGKSSFTMQCAVLWSLGKPAFGIQPARPLRTLIVQAENDDGDMSEIVDGVYRGLELSQQDQAAANASVETNQCNHLAGPEFCTAALRPLLENYKPDLLFIDPILAFLGGDASSQRDVTAFLRNQLQPLLTEFNCAVVGIHHTNKPTSGKENPNWQAGDFAYLGSGSAEFANWARGVLGVLSIGSHTVFQLVAGKRGSRLGWKEADGVTKAYSKMIAHSKDPSAIYWREVDASEVPEQPTKTGKPAPTVEALLAHVPTDRSIDKAVLMDKAAATMGRAHARAMLARCLDESLLYVWEIPRKPRKPEIRISRLPQPEPTLV